MPSAGSCRICDHPRAEDINTELLTPGMNRRSLRGVASLFHVSPETLRRHYQKCLGQGPEPTEGPQEPENVYGGTLEVNHEQVTKMIELNERAQRCGNPAQMMIITRELVKLLTEMVKGDGSK